uniref:Secreted protein n=1 Tax=Pyxicephalus adspersus TaxID=30357 RepID=A0AAV3AGA0_PYXAD|nr:TPA: hypothetical protein GDO54_010552 [Pyxicephalus adspersus]
MISNMHLTWMSVVVVHIGVSSGSECPIFTTAHGTSVRYIPCSNSHHANLRGIFFFPGHRCEKHYKPLTVIQKYILLLNANVVVLLPQ